MSEFETFEQEEVVESEPTTVVQPQGEYTRIIGLDVANSTLKICTDELNLKYVNTIRQNNATRAYEYFVN